MTLPKVARTSIIDPSSTLRRRQKNFPCNLPNDNQRSILLFVSAFLVYYMFISKIGSNGYDSSISVMTVEDGCNVIGAMDHEHTKIQWKPYTSQEYETLHQIQQCMKRIDHKKKENLEDRNDIPLTTLKCHEDGMDDMVKDPSIVVSKFNEIHFIGDSVLRQQFMALCCWLDPNIELVNTTSTSKSQQEGFIGMYHHHDTTTAKDKDSSKTILRYSHFGFLKNTNQTMYEVKDGLFPQAFDKSSSSSSGNTNNDNNNTAIVFNMGFHFDKTRASTLYESAQIIQGTLVSMKHKTKKNPPQVYYMETPDEQWPTSNGLYTKSCYESCECESLTPQRIQGNGDFSSIAARDVRRGMPFYIDNVFRPIYPDLFTHSPMDPSDSFYGRCVPDCLPANWRNELVHTVFQNTKKKKKIRKESATSSSNDEVIQIVPIWNQLVSQGVPHMVKHGDCTHKSSDSLLLMNQQLVRQMIKKS